MGNAVISLGGAAGFDALQPFGIVGRVSFIYVYVWNRDSAGICMPGTGYYRGSMQVLFFPLLLCASHLKYRLLKDIAIFLLLKIASVSWYLGKGTRTHW